MDFNNRQLSPALGAQWTFAFCKLLILQEWSGRKDLNLRPPGPEPGALARLRYAPTVCSESGNASPQGLLEYHSRLASATVCFAIRLGTPVSQHVYISVRYSKKIPG